MLVVYQESFPLQSVNIVNKIFVLTTVHWNQLCGHWFNADWNGSKHCTVCCNMQWSE